MTTIVILAAMLCDQTRSTYTGPNYPQPPANAVHQATYETAAPGWVWVSNQGRYGWGRIVGGYFREEALPAPVPAPAPVPEPEPQTDPFPSVGAQLANGVLISELNKTPGNTFTSNDPNFRPANVSESRPTPHPSPPAPVASRVPKEALYAAFVAVAALVIAVAVRSQKPQ